MAERTERCKYCRHLLLIPPNAKTIQCAVCGKITKSRSRNPVREAKNWVKGIIAQFSYGYPSNPSSSQLANGGPSLIRSAGYLQVYGKKRALLIGITYTGRGYELRGTVNDVKGMKFLLVQKYGFPDEAIVILTEEETDPCRIPTRKNILAAMKWLVRDCEEGDSLVFHFSGHGSQKVDSKGDEKDGFDETICPLDYETNGMIIDDEINSIMVRPLTIGVKLHAIIDACHSGTALDLPYLCRMNRSGYWQWEDHCPGEERGTSGGLAISFSGCDDNQTSADTSALAGDRTTGAMTYAFIQAVQNEPGATYGRVLWAMRYAIRNANTGFSLNRPISSLIKRTFKSGLTQEPQLCSSEVFDVYKTPFTL